MNEAASTKSNSIDRHFLLQSIVSEVYKRRKEERFRWLCIQYAEKHLREFPPITGPLKEDMGGELHHVSTSQQYSTVLTEAGEFEKAVARCEQAMTYGLHDNTTSGFEGRIERIRKKAGQENA